MEMSIQHNLAAYNANRQFNITTKKRAKSSEKLSSGYRVNRAADDAAGLAISEKMRRQIKGLTQASRNAQDGISMVQIADGALNEIHSMLHRANELAIQAANGTLSTKDRGYIQQEIDHLSAEVNGISERTTFNEILVLKGGGNWETVTDTYIPQIHVAQPVANSDLPNGVSFDPASAANGYLSQHTAAGEPSATLDFSGVTNISDLNGKGFYTTCCTCQNHYSFKFDTSTSASSVSGSQHFTYTIGLQGVTTVAGVVQAIVDATAGCPNGHYTMLEADGEKLIIHDNRSNVSAGPGSGLVGSGVTEEVIQDGTPVLTTRNIITPGRVINLQVGAEGGQKMGIQLPDISSTLVGLSAVNVRTPQAASNSIQRIKQGLEYVSTERSRMGAYQNRLEHTINNLDNVVENTSAAESQIRDTDMAKEMVEYSNQGILEQAGQSMLSHANQQKQTILSLLQ